MIQFSNVLSVVFRVNTFLLHLGLNNATLSTLQLLVVGIQKLFS